MAYDDKKAGAPKTGRREALRILGAGALTVLASSVVTGQAGAAPQDARLAVGGGGIDTLPLAKLNASQLATLRLTQRASRSTSITQLGLTPEGQELLTPAARALTKADLESLGQGGKAGALGRLTVNDIASIRTAFGTEYRPGLGMARASRFSIDISCCCCTPCCCAAAVSEPLALAA